MTIETPFGPVQAVVNGDGALTELKFGTSNKNGNSNTAGNSVMVTRSVTINVKRQLDEFFAGQRTTFDLPMAPAGTEFQKRVWAELTRIPYGETISYAELAKRVGSEG